MEYQPLDPAQTLEVERELENLKTERERTAYTIEIGKTLADLKEDDRYKKVFDEYYLKSEVIRDTMLMAEKYFLEPDQRQSLQDGLIAKSFFNDWVKATVSMETLSVNRMREIDEKIQQLNSLLSAGIPIEAATPPEGEPNVR